MTRSRKLTLSVKEFSQLVSEALDVAHNAPPSQTFIDHTTLFSEAPQKHRPQPSSSFQRIFSRPTPTPGQLDDSPDEHPENLFNTPRKMIAWPFARSPRKNRPSKDDGAVAPKQEAHHPGVYPSPYAFTSPAATSTSSLGSLIPANERLFQVTPRNSDEPNQNCDLFSDGISSPTAASINEPPDDSGHYADAASLRAIFGSSSANSSVINPASDIIRPSFEGTTASLSVANSERESFDDDPTPRAASFGPQMSLSPADTRDEALPLQRVRPQRPFVVVPLRDADVIALRPAIGVAPHVPSETESSVSVCTSSPTSPVAGDSSSAFSTTRPSSPGTSSPCVSPSTPPNLRISAVFPNIVSPSNAETAPPVGFSPRQRKRALSRSMTPPPLPRPPPTGPLPAVPSPIPPVPPLPPLLHKLSTNLAPMSSPPRLPMAGTPMNPATALPPSPPGGLRLPSRLSWINGVRAVLPSPPASPTKSIKSLASKVPHPTSPSKMGQRRPNELKRPTSIGVIEAADNAHVRRTKSILLLGSRSKSNTSLGMKRVQIHADVNLEAAPSRKPRRKSSAATVGHPIFSSDIHPLITPMTSAELLVPRERRHSAPMLSTLRDVSASEDWTLSLPFCTDVPGNKILPSPVLTPQLKPELVLEEVQGEDWTLCMPLKMRAGTPTESDTFADGSETCRTQTTMITAAAAAAQLPTPSSSPTCSTPCSVACPLPEESVPEPVPEERPVSPASLGPHAGGLDLGGRGKRASGWHVYGWFDEVNVVEETETDADDIAPLTVVIPDNGKVIKNHVMAFRRTQDARHPSQDSTSSVSTVFYSARSSLVS